MRSMWLSSWEIALRVEHGVIGRVLEGITDVLSQRIFWVMIERVESMGVSFCLVWV